MHSLRHSASEVSTVRRGRRARIYGDFDISGNGKRAGVSTVWLTLRLGDVCATLEKDEQRENYFF